MLAVDPTLKFSAIELSSYGQPIIPNTQDQAATYLPLILPSSGGLNAPVDAVSTHFYGTCHAMTTDTSLFSGLSQFVVDIDTFHTTLTRNRPDLGNVPVWVT